MCSACSTSVHRRPTKIRISSEQVFRNMIQTLELIARLKYKIITIKTWKAFMDFNTKLKYNLFLYYYSNGLLFDVKALI